MCLRGVKERCNRWVPIPAPPCSTMENCWERMLRSILGRNHSHSLPRCSLHHCTPSPMCSSTMALHHCAPPPWCSSTTVLFHHDDHPPWCSSTTVLLHHGAPSLWCSSTTVLLYHSDPLPRCSSTTVFLHHSSPPGAPPWCSFITAPSITVPFITVPLQHSSPSSWCPSIIVFLYHSASSLTSPSILSLPLFIIVALLHSAQNINNVSVWYLGFIHELLGSRFLGSFHLSDSAILVDSHRFRPAPFCICCCLWE